MHDELRRLDEDLAAGRLDADTYRRRRDELLATRLPEPPPLPSRPAAEPQAVEPQAAEPVEAVEPRAAAGGPDRIGAVGSSPDEVATDEVDAVGTGRDEVDAGDPAPDGVTPADPAPADPAPDGVTPGGPAPADPTLDGPVPCPAVDARDPFPPPFRWDGAGGAGDGSDAVADATQVVAARPAADDAPERTQVVRGAPAGRSLPGAADATQVVGRSGVRVPDPRREPWRAGPLAPPAQPERTQFVPGAALTRAGDLRSVPARRTVPPWADGRATRPADARRPGREVFARGRGPSPAAVIGTAALVLVVLVVLALSFLLG